MTYVPAIIAVPSNKNDSIFIECNLQVLDGCDLLNNVEDLTLLPDEPGIYSCTVRIDSFQSNPPFCPPEWDTILTIENIKKIEIPELEKLRKEIVDGR